MYFLTAIDSDYVHNRTYLISKRMAHALVVSRRILHPVWSVDAFKMQQVSAWLNLSSSSSATPNILLVDVSTSRLGLTWPSRGWFELRTKQVIGWHKPPGGSVSTSDEQPCDSFRRPSPAFVIGGRRLIDRSAFIGQEHRYSLQVS